MTERIHWIDVMKGVLMLMVIMGHIGYCSSLSLGYKPEGLAFTIVSMAMCIFCVQFYMAAFFFVTGYCYSDKTKPYLSQLKKDFLTLIIPALIIPRVMNIVTWNDMSFASFFNPIHELPWFLVALFWSKQIYYVTKKLQEPIKICVLLILSVVGILLLNWLPQYNVLFVFHSMVFAFFIYVGERLKAMNPSKRFIYVVAILYVILASVHYKFTHAIIGICGAPTVTWQYIPSWLILAILGTVCTLAVSMLIGKNRLLEFVGRNSLVMYLTHFSWLMLSASFMSQYINNHNGETMMSFVVVSVMIVGAVMWSSVWSLAYNRVVLLIANYYHRKETL